MSNTSRVTPYDRRSASTSTQTGSKASTAPSVDVGAGALLVLGFAATCFAGAVIGAAGAVRWLCEETPEDREVRSSLKTERHQELRASIEAERMMSYDLHQEELEPLVAAAAQLGYHEDHHWAEERQADRRHLVLLANSSGQRLAIGRNDKGRLTVATAGAPQRLQALVRQHTLKRAVEHLAAKGMAVQSATLPNGEIQLLARETGQGEGDGAAEVRTQINTDGSLWVDIDRCAGNRCERIVGDLATAIGGKVTSMKKKDACFQLPGEATKPQLMV